MDGPTWPGLPTFLDELSEEARGRVKAELMPGEPVLWGASARPRDTPLVGRMAWFPIGCSGFFLAVCVACLGAYFGSWGGALAGIPGWASAGVLAGVISLVVAFILCVVFVAERMESKIGADSVYVLTDRRAILWQPDDLNPESIVIHSLRRGEVGHIGRTEHPDGLGDVDFALFGESERDRLRLSFVGISDPSGVEALARRVLMEGAESPRVVAPATPAEQTC